MQPYRPLPVTRRPNRIPELVKVMLRDMAILSIVPGLALLVVWISNW